VRRTARDLSCDSCRPGAPEIRDREFRNHGGDVADRVTAGAHLTVNRSAKPVAELRPVGRSAVKAEVLLDRLHRLPTSVLTGCATISTNSSTRRCDGVGGSIGAQPAGEFVSGVGR